MKRIFLFACVVALLLGYAAQVRGDQKETVEVPVEELKELRAEHVGIRAYNDELEQTVRELRKKIDALQAATNCV